MSACCDIDSSQISGKVYHMAPGDTGFAIVERCIWPNMDDEDCRELGRLCHDEAFMIIANCTDNNYGLIITHDLIGWVISEE